MAGSLRILPSVACCWCHLNPEFQMTENPSHVRVESDRSHADRENHWPGWGPQGRLYHTPLGANFLCVVAVFDLPEQRVCVCVRSQGPHPLLGLRGQTSHTGEGGHANPACRHLDAKYIKPLNSSQGVE